jgi:hypothetical protein
MNDRQQIDNLRANKAIYDHMVHLWPITVEIYPTGQVAFVARPGGRGKRWNKTFSTSTFESPQRAAGAAIDFCKRVLSGTDDEVNHVGKIREKKKLARYAMTEEEYKLCLQAKRRGMDLAGILKREIEHDIIAEQRARWGNQK